MDPVDIDDIDQDHMLTRSNSWSHAQRPAFLDTSKAIGRAVRPNGLSCIYETDDSVSVNQEHDLGADTQRNRSKSISSGLAGQGQAKKRRHSYTELIASAILSSPEKRKTLAEIYDWFVLNVPSFKDQRYMHSSLGWKNAVRHNLSVQTCFKRVKRHGMEKPSWWTVDMAEVAKRRLVLRPTVNASNHGSGDIDIEGGGPFLPPRRNTYSGPHPNAASTISNDTSGINKTTCRVASTNDLVSATNIQFMNGNAKRTHYAPIRPAVSGHPPDIFMVGNGGYATPGSGGSPYNEMSGIKTDMDDVFLKPCAVDASPVRSNNLNNNPTLVPSVTLVCKESPSSDHLYRQAQLEVSFQANDGSTPVVSSTSSPTMYNWVSSSTNSPCSQASPSPNSRMPTVLGHFNTWPTMSEANVDNRGGAAAPNQTLRVKTLRGNVEDINFNGLLPMRTVVKCDGMTQTDEANEKRDVMSKNFERPQWDQTLPNGYDQSYNSYFRESALTADLPEDLAGLQIEGDLQCDINEVLGAGFGQANKPTWSWSWNNASCDQSPSAERVEDSSLLNLNSGLARSPFACASMDVSEL